jgi:hypothetical protein
MTTLFLTLCTAIGDGRVPKPIVLDKGYDLERTPTLNVIWLDTDNFQTATMMWQIAGYGDVLNFCSGIGPDSLSVKITSPEHLNELLEGIPKNEQTT